jgi:Ca2+-binding EF-hand superfamily protein
MTRKQFLEATLEKVRTLAKKMLVSNRQFVGSGLDGFQGKPLTRDQFKTALRTQFNANLSEKEMRVLFGHFDHDHSGEIDFIEVKAAFMNPERLVAAIDKDVGHHGNMFNEAMDQVRALQKATDGEFNLQRCFEACDINNDGKVSREEFKTTLKELGCNMNNRQQAALFAFLDPNGDGDVDYGEFAWAFFNRRQKLQTADTHRMEPWRPVRLGKAKESVSSDMVHAYTNCHAPFIEEHNAKLKDQVREVTHTIHCTIHCALYS